MAERSHRIRLEDIREEIAGIRDLVAGADVASFSASCAMKRAVQHALLIIAVEIGLEIRPRRPEAPPIA